VEKDIEAREGWIFPDTLFSAKESKRKMQIK
jgi:hypothetical protein